MCDSSELHRRVGEMIDQAASEALGPNLIPPALCSATVPNETVGRPDWDTYFLDVAETVSTRSSCVRAKVGALVVKDRRIRSSGYNDAPAGEPGCESCPRRLSTVQPGSDYDSGPGRCVAVHAEENALLYCNREDLVGATLYVTREPCYACTKSIKAVGIERVVTPFDLEE